MNKYIQSSNAAHGNGENTKPERKEKTVRVNWKIFNKYSRVIEQGKPPRIMLTKDAIEYAQHMGLDLVEIGYDRQNDCSNCKIYDYGKFVYEQKQREKAAKKAARASQTEIKCLQMSLTTDTADLDRMVEHAMEFLTAGHKVKIALRFRGRRELANLELAKTIMKNVLTKFDNVALLDSAPQLNGKELGCVIRSAKCR